MVVVARMVAAKRVLFARHTQRFQVEHASGHGRCGVLAGLLHSCRFSAERLRYSKLAAPRWFALPDCVTVSNDIGGGPLARQKVGSRHVSGGEKFDG